MNDVANALVEYFRLKSEGEGSHPHEGRPGQVGGSAPKEEGSEVTDANPDATKAPVISSSSFIIKAKGLPVSDTHSKKYAVYCNGIKIGEKGRTTSSYVIGKSNKVISSWFSWNQDGLTELLGVPIKVAGRNPADFVHSSTDLRAEDVIWHIKRWLKAKGR